MSPEFWQIDFPALLVSMLAAFSCAVIGSFLVLRRQAMMSDALSHVVLPGLAVAFIISGTISAVYMMLGALGACLVAVFLIRILKENGQIESSAAIGIVFTALFALGLVLLETQVGSKVHLDAHHALYGSLELSYWPSPVGWETMPMQIRTLGLLSLLTLVFVVLFFKELKVSSFDPVFADVTGFRASLISTLLMVMTALVAVACFEAVGSILVIALFICPPAAARMLCDTLQGQLIASAVLGVISGVSGYVLAVVLPLSIGYAHSLSAGGMIALSAGFIQLLCMLFSPRYGYFRTGMHRQGH